MNARTLLRAAALAGIGASASAADPIKILFVGNSFSAGSNPFAPHRWGGMLAVPEPGTWALLGGLVLVARGRKDVRLRR